MIRLCFARIASTRLPIRVRPVGGRSLPIGLTIALAVAVAGPACSTAPVTTSDASAAPDAVLNAMGCTDPDPGILDVIDNMEDGDALVLARDGRTGGWYTYHDETPGTLNPDMGTPPAMETIVDGRCGTSTRAMRVTGTGFSNWGAGFGFAFKSVQTDAGYTSGPYDISAYRGVTFWARAGESSITAIRLGIGDQWNVPQGGHCEATELSGPTACYDNFGSSVALSTIWKRYTVLFGELQQRSFGMPRPALDVTAAHLIEFNIPPSAPVFDIWIDDVALFK